MFLESLKEYKSITEWKQLIIKAKEIFHRYMTAESLFEINATAKCLKKIDAAISTKENIDKELFKDVENNILWMLDDKFEDFKKTEIFQNSIREHKRKIDSKKLKNMKAISEKCVKSIPSVYGLIGKLNRSFVLNSSSNLKRSETFIGFNTLEKNNLFGRF